MKTLRTITEQGVQLAVVITEIEEGKAQVEYFVNGYQALRWSDLKPIYQKLLTVLADDECELLRLVKWSY